MPALAQASHAAVHAARVQGMRQGGRGRDAWCAACSKACNDDDDDDDARINVWLLALACLPVRTTPRPCGCTSTCGGWRDGCGGVSVTYGALGRGIGSGVFLPSSRTNLTRSTAMFDRLAVCMHVRGKWARHTHPPTRHTSTTRTKSCWLSPAASADPK